MGRGKGGVSECEKVLKIVTQHFDTLNTTEGFPSSTASKESACNAGDPGSIPGSGRSPGEGPGYPLQYSWASLVVQTVKNPPAVWETWVRSLHWEDVLEEGMATHSSILAWRIPMDRGAWWAHRVRHDKVTKQSTVHTTEVYTWKQSRW